MQMKFYRLQLNSGVNTRLFIRGGQIRSKTSALKALLSMARRAVS